MVEQGQHMKLFMSEFPLHQQEGQAFSKDG